MVVVVLVATQSTAVTAVIQSPLLSQQEGVLYNALHCLSVLVQYEQDQK